MDEPTMKPLLVAVSSVVGVRLCIPIQLCWNLNRYYHSHGNDIGCGPAQVQTS